MSWRNKGALGRARILAVSGLVEGYFDSRGWGLGVAMMTRSGNAPGSVGQFGSDGGVGTSWRSDPRQAIDD